MRLFSSFCGLSAIATFPKRFEFQRLTLDQRTSRCNIPSQHQTVEYENSIKPGNISYLHVCGGSRARNLDERFIFFLRTSNSPSFVSTQSCLFYMKMPTIPCNFITYFHLCKSHMRHCNFFVHILDAPEFFDRHVFIPG